MIYDFKKFVFKKKTTKKRINRKASQNKSITPQLRTVTRSYVAQQTHNKIQEALKNKLISKYGEKNVILEEREYEFIISEELERLRIN